MFPDLPENEAKDRFFYTNNRLAYKDGVGNAYYYDPEFRAPTSVANLRESAKAIGSGVGGSLSTIGGGIGGAITVGVGGGIPGAVIGGGLAEGARLTLAKILGLEKKTPGDAALQIGGAGLSEGAGQVVGLGVGKGLSRFGRTPAFNLPESNALRDKAAEWGIFLTPGEETGSRQLIRQQKILANSQFSDDIIADKYLQRNGEVNSAINRLAARIDPLRTSPRATAQYGVEGAQNAVAQARQDVKDFVSPMYQRAEQQPGRLLIDEELFNRPSMGPAVGYAKKVAAERGETITVPTYENGVRVQDEVAPDWKSAEYIKRSLDNTVKSETDQFGRPTPYGLAVQDTVGKLRGQIDAQNPTMAVARKAFQEAEPFRRAIEQGPVGDAARLTGDDVMLAPRILFGKGSSPQGVREAREAFINGGKPKLAAAQKQLIDAGFPEQAALLKNPGEEQWNSLLSSHIQQVFREIPDSSVGKITNVGGTLRKALVGKEWQRELMDEAFAHDPKLKSDFNSLMDVLDATGRAMSGESATAFFQMGQKELAQEAKGVIPKILDTVEVWKQPGRLAQYWADIQTGKYAAKMATLLTTPGGREQLRQLRTIGPTSKAGTILLGHMLMSGGEAGAESLLSPTRNGPVNK
ncbi:MAG: hypothetical protein EBR82_44785 [Caulobacteraceae bacterium]|nr:hypothetical protein [Caulobacteraceae bacterium]